MEVESNMTFGHPFLAHTAAHAAHAGVDDEKVAKVWEFETSGLITWMEANR